MTPWTVACQIPLSMGFSIQEYWNGLPCPSPEDFPDPGITPVSHYLDANYFSAKFHKTLYNWEKLEFGLTCPTFESWHHHLLSVISEVLYPKIHFYHLLSTVTARGFRRIKWESKCERRNSCELQFLIHNPKSTSKTSKHQSFFINLGSEICPQLTEGYL